MVQGILRSLTTSIRGLHQAAYLLAGLTLASQILSLLRDRIFADAFGASITLDLYYAAFRIPDLVFALIASLVSAYVLIPRIAAKNQAASQSLLSNAASFLVLGGGVFALVLAVWMPQLLALFFPGLAGTEGFVDLARILLLQPILLGLSGIFTSVTQVERRFVLFALSPVLYNVGIIFGTVFLYPAYGLPGIGVGVVLGALAHLLIHIPVVAGAKLMPKPVIPDTGIMWSVVKDSVPRSLALSFGAFTTLALTAIAATTGEGGVSVYTLAGNLAAVPLALIGASYATAAFPVLAEEAQGNRMDSFKATLSAAARHLIFWSVTAALLTIVLRAHLVRVILGSGAFDWDATRLTAAILGVLIVGLVAQGLVLLASRAFYAARRSWNPLAIQVIGLAISAAGALFFLALSREVPLFKDFIEALLRVEGIAGTSILFVALGATVGQLFMGALALATLGRVAPGVAASLVRPLFEGAGAGMVGASAAYSVLAVAGNIAPLTTVLSVFTQGLVAGMVGLAASAAVLVLLENREFRDLYASLRRLTSARALTPAGTVLNDQANP
ncbi:MAG TPA: lipid II flippase MurJ [Candidatus Paceibacterota bacterium]|nr:lipid II flippase MurJ [Candidatus Paceibacterota bacterium]